MVWFFDSYIALTIVCFPINSRGTWGSISKNISQDGKSIKKTFLSLHIHGTPRNDPTNKSKRLDFSSEPGVANEILENEAKSCLAVA